MPTTPERAAFIREQFRVVSAPTNPTIEALYGSDARRTTEPIETFFEAEADAQAIRDERAALLGINSRRIRMTVSGEKTGLDMAYIGTPPTVVVVDTDKQANFPALVSEIGLNFDSETTELEVWGESVETPPEQFARITDAGDVRITDTGDTRIAGE